MLDRLKRDRDAALKRRDTITVRVLRMLLSELHNQEIAAGGDLDEKEVIRVLRKAVKQREEATEQYEAGGRVDRAEEERAEIRVIEEDLPDFMDERELGAAVDEVIEDTGATSMSDMGEVMGELMQRHGPRVDGKVASGLVRERLGS